MVNVLKFWMFSHTTINKYFLSQNACPDSNPRSVCVCIGHFVKYPAFEVLEYLLFCTIVNYL